MKLNFLIYLLAAISPVVDSDDWSPVEKSETTRPMEDEEYDLSVWPVFSKKVGSDTVIIRFPADPTYRYLSSSEIEISSTQGNETSQLTILDPTETDIFEKRLKEISAQAGALVISVEQSDSETLDLRYFSQGKWVAERILATPEHLFVFQTSSPEPLTGNHQRFVSSFGTK